MGLDDIQKKLYKPDEEFKARSIEGSDFGVDRTDDSAGPEERQGESVKQGVVEKASGAAYSFFSKKFLLVGGIVFLLLIIGLVGFVYWYARSSFDRAWVSIEINGPERIVSGEEISYLVKCKNSTKISLADAQLTFRWPEGSLPDSGQIFEKIDIGSLGPQETKEIAFKGKIIGLKAVQKEV